MTLNARLDKSGEWVLCGRLTCGTRIAAIMPESAYQSVRLLWLDPRWSLGIDGVWRLSRRAERKQRGGRRFTPRRFWTSEGRGVPGGRLPGDATGAVAGDDRLGMVPYGLPIILACPYPSCGHVQTADPVSLNIDPHPAPVDAERIDGRRMLPPQGPGREDTILRWLGYPIDAS